MDQPGNITIPSVIPVKLVKDTNTLLNAALIKVWPLGVKTIAVKT